MAPASVELSGRGRTAVIEVTEGETVELECRVEDSKPVAAVRWFRDGQEVHLGESRAGRRSEGAGLKKLHGVSGREKEDGWKGTSLTDASVHNAVVID